MTDNPVGLHVVRASIAFGIIDAIAVSLRMLARWRSNAAFAADDALIVASLAPLFAMIVIGHLCQSNTLVSDFLLLTRTGVEAGDMGLSTAISLDLGHGTSRISVLLKLMMSGIVMV